MGLAANNTWEGEGISVKPGLFWFVVWPTDLIKLSALLAFSLWELDYFLLALSLLFVLSLLRPLRYLYALVCIAVIVGISDSFLTSYFKALDKAQSTFGYYVALTVGIVFSLWALRLFGRVLVGPLLYRGTMRELYWSDEEEVEEDQHYDQRINQEGPEQKNDDFDPYLVLDLARTADFSDIRTAYRKQMQLYHPDRVASLGPELQKTAHEQSLLIQRAYETVKADL